MERAILQPPPRPAPEPPRAESQIGGQAWRQTDTRPPARLPQAAPMGMLAALSSAFRRYFTFSGRARRAEYWWFIAFQFIAVAILVLFQPPRDASQDGGGLVPLFLLLTFMPNLTLHVRRLHDVGESGWWLVLPMMPLGALISIGQTAGPASGPVMLLFLFLSLVSLVCSILILIWTLSKSEPGTNRFGPSPLEQAS